MTPDLLFRRMAPLVEGKKGEAIADKLWGETMAELSFANVEETLVKVKRG